ncbi:MAG: polyprenyl synthetase family protein [Anaerolineae bacterium]|nr:polyprenyl synthetase family protein [Thermoflexales bacterium]MDW8054657.1 polyprenyl synthetase family protein [Anaerolineae bacterium]
MTALLPHTSPAAPYARDGHSVDLSRVHALTRSQLVEVEAQLRNLPDLQPEALREAVIHIVAAGGKRLRPAITVLVAGLFSRADDRRVIDLASAVEMLHTATLVHDDLIDGSLMRRGAQTLNAVWTPAATVLTGDYLFAYAANLAARTQNTHVMSIFADTLSVIVAGELQQQFTDFALRATREDYYRRIYSKTASMFVLATTACGVLCEANAAQLEALRAYGHDLGLAFQIMDDVLDFTGDVREVGKPVGSDLRRGLITLPVICYIETHGKDGLECALQGRCAPEAYDAIITCIRHSDAIQRAIEEAQQLGQRARAALTGFPPSPYRDALMDLVDYTLARTH